MSKKKKDEHIHKYKRLNIAAYPKKPYLVFKCTKPLCSHYVPLDLALGKLCECNRCHNTMILTKENITLALPHCVDCTKRRPEKSDVESIAQYLNKSGL